MLELPVELVYRILDNLDYFTISCSVRNACTRLNMIIDTYDRYQVNLTVIIESNVEDSQTITQFHR